MLKFYILSFISVLLITTSIFSESYNLSKKKDNLLKIKNYRVAEGIIDGFSKSTKPRK